MCCSFSKQNLHHENSALMKKMSMLIMVMVPPRTISNQCNNSNEWKTIASWNIQLMIWSFVEHLMNILSVNKLNAKQKRDGYRNLDKTHRTIDVWIVKKRKKGEEHQLFYCILSIIYFFIFFPFINQYFYSYPALRLFYSWGVRRLLSQTSAWDSLRNQS